MSVHELVIAPAATGLFQGTSGFCPVALSENFPREGVKPLWEFARLQVQQLAQSGTKLDQFAGYLPWKITEQSFALLVRGERGQTTGAVADNPDGENFTVQLRLISHAQRLTCGPAALLADAANWYPQWTTQPKKLPPRELTDHPLSPRICRTWENSLGDPGWAASPWETWESRRHSCWLVPPEFSFETILQLLVESQSLVPAAVRWQVPLMVWMEHPRGLLPRQWSVQQQNSERAWKYRGLSDCEILTIAPARQPSDGRYAESARAGAWITLASLATSNGSGDKASPANQLAEKNSPQKKLTEKKLPEKNLTPHSPRTPAPAPKPSGGAAPAASQPTSSAQSANSQGSAGAATPAAKTKTADRSPTTATKSASPSKPRAGVAARGPLAPAPPRRPATAPPKSSVSPQLIGKAVLWGGIVLGLAGIVYGIYVGVGYLQLLANTWQQQSLTPVIEKPSEPAEKKPEPPPVVEKETPPPPPPPPALLTVAELTELAATFERSQPAIDLRDFADTLPHRLGTLPALPGYREQVQLFLDTSHERLQWKDTHAESPEWLLVMTDPSGNGEPQELATIRAVPTSDNGAVDLMWQWRKWPVDPLFFGLVCSGQTSLSYVGEESRELRQWPNTLPSAAPAFRLHTVNWQPQPLPLPLGDYLSRQTAFNLFEWVIDKVTLPELPTAEAGDSGSEDQREDAGNEPQPTWSGPVWLPVEPADKTFLAKLNPDYLQWRLMAELSPREADKLSVQELVEQILREHGPFGLELSWELAAADSTPYEQIRLGVQTRLLINDPGADNSAVSLKPGPEIKKLADAQTEAQRKLGLGLMRFLGLTDETQAKIVAAGGKGWKRVKDPVLQKKALLGGLLYAEISRVMDQEWRVQLTRVQRPQARQPGRFKTPVWFLE